MQDFDYAIFLENYMQINTFLRENGVEHTVIKSGEIESTMEILDKHLSSPNTAHGGAMAGFMDSILGFCALSTTIPEGNLVSTVEFKLNYFKPLFLGDKLTGKTKVIRKGKSLIISIAEVWRGEDIVAHGQGTFNVYPLAKRADSFR